MGLKFFADHCISRVIVKRLLDAGHEVLVLRDHLLQDAADPVVIKKAQDEKAILITLNGDFSDIVAYPPSDFGGIIALQIKNRPIMVNPIMERLISYTESYPDQGDYASVPGAQLHLWCLSSKENPIRLCHTLTWIKPKSDQEFQSRHFNFSRSPGTYAFYPFTFNF